MSAAIEIIEEHDVDRGWAFTFLIEGENRTRSFRLSWADYNHWAPGGDRSPSQIADAVLSFFLHAWADAHPEEEPPQTIDASTVRRLYPRVDEAL